jgi:hypothetical protein
VAAPNVNGVVEAPLVGAVLVKPLSKVNGAAPLVVAGFIDDPNGNVLSKIFYLELN